MGNVITSGVASSPPSRIACTVSTSQPRTSMPVPVSVRVTSSDQVGDRFSWRSQVPFSVRIWSRQASSFWLCRDVRVGFIRRRRAHARYSCRRQAG